MPTLLYGTGVYGDTYGEAADGGGTMASVSSEPVDDRLFVAITHANGRKSRWGPDEPDASGIPQNIQVSSSSPGGFKDFGCSLARDPRRDWPDLDLLDEVEVYGRSAPDGRKAFEGQQEQFPSQLGDSFEIAVNAIGWQAVLEDRKDFQQIYLDRDVSHWEETPLARRVRLTVTDGVSLGEIGWQQITGGWQCDFPTNALGTKTAAEFWYVAPAGLKVATLNYAGDGTGSLTGWIEQFHVTDNADGTSTTDHTQTLSGTLQSWTPATPRRYLYEQLYSNNNITTPTSGTHRRLSNLGVIGNHGLNSVTGGDGNPGFYGHHILGDLVSGAPPLTYEIGKTIAENTSFVVPHFAFLSPTTRWDAIQQLNAYFLWRLEIWEDKKVWWQPWDPGPLTWKARIQGGAHWSPAGRQASTLFNGVIVSYTDVSGQKRTAGPPGSGCDDESTLLQDTSSSNPVTAHGRTRWELIDVGFALTGGASGSAVQIGYVWMQEHQIPQRRGTLVVKPLGPGHIPQLEHPTAGPLPIWACRPGDFVELVDFPDREPFRVLEASYNHQSKTGTFQLDNSALKLDGILARVGIRSQGVF